MNLPVKPLAVLGLVKEVGKASQDERPLAVGGALATLLRKQLAAGGDELAVREGGPEGAAAYVHVIGTAPTDEDEAMLKRARKARVPIVCLARERYVLPDVLATDVLLVPPGQGFPVDELTRALANRLGASGPALAARLPVLRKAVVARLIANASRRNGLVGAAVFIPGVDLPVLTMTQLRLVLAIAAAHGVEISNDRVPELAAVLGGGFGLRAAARELLDFAPGIGWLVKGAIAYTGTRAIGEAADRYFALRASGAGGGGTPARA